MVTNILVGYDGREEEEEEDGKPKVKTKRNAFKWG
jgi:hypothetical protein